MKAVLHVRDVLHSVALSSESVPVNPTDSILINIHVLHRWFFVSIGFSSGFLVLVHHLGYHKLADVDVDGKLHRGSRELGRFCFLRSVDICRKYHLDYC